MPTGDYSNEEVNSRKGEDNYQAWFANVKRTYDEFQQESLESIRRSRDYIGKVLSDAQQHDNHRQAIANQALQNAVETANMVSKRAVEAGDIKLDRTWNVDEQGYTARNIISDENFRDAIKTIVIEILKSKDE